MSELMHPIYTEIPQRSYDALVRNGMLEEVLLALITDPLAAEDMWEEIVRDTKVRPSVTSRDFADLGVDMLSKWRITTAQWVTEERDALGAMRWITTYDCRLGIWCTCRVAREMLRSVHPRELALHTSAIEISEAWLKGQATIEQVRESAVYVTNTSSSTYYAVTAAAYSDFASKRSDMALHVGAMVRADANTKPGCTRWLSVFNEELSSLKEVVANACFSFPVEAM